MVACFDPLLYALLEESQIPPLSIIFLDSTKLKIVWTKITTFFKRSVSIIL